MLSLETLDSYFEDNCYEVARIADTDIPILNSPEGIAFDSTNENVYVAAEGGAVSVISGQTNTVIATIPLQLPEDPYAIAFDSTNGNLYVTNSAGNTVSVIFGQTNTVVGTPIPVGTAPQGIAFDSTNGNLYVTNRGANTVSVISTAAIPPTTTITSAVDGNNVPIQNGGTTTSISIKFTFGATGGLPPYTFDCTLDGIPVGCVQAGTTFTNLAAGQHMLSVAAVDSLGSRDPNPPVFSWTINPVIPTQSIEQIIQQKHSMHLSPSSIRRIMASNIYS